MLEDEHREYNQKVEWSMKENGKEEILVTISG